MQKAMKKWFPVLVLPTLAAFLIAFIIPFIMGIYLSFTKFSTVKNAQWVGIENYIKAFSNADFINALWFTVKFTVVSVITINILAFLLALLLTKAIKGTNLFRTTFFLPNLIGGIVLGYIWLMIINGVLYYSNATITTDPAYGFWGLVILMNWQLVGYMMIIYIAGIQNVSPELMEAADIDGANSWQKFWYVTLPGIMPTIFYLLIAGISAGLLLYDMAALIVPDPWGSTIGGQDHMALTLMRLVFYFNEHRGTDPVAVSAASAISWILFLLIAPVSVWLYSRREKKMEG